MTKTTVSDAVDASALCSYLGAIWPDVTAVGALDIELLAGGHSNLTFSVRSGARRWVLRRPPLGRRDASAHDMFREFRVMNALGGSAVPVPQMLHYCDDASVIGAPFFLSSFVDGTVYRTREQTARLGADGARAVSLELIDVLARLHLLDPAEVGLAELGRPHGYLERQVGRWSKAAGRVIGSYQGVHELIDRLAAGRPDSDVAAIVHGDYRLDNALVTDGRIAAVVDWEMATLGDPFADLGLLWCYWEGLPNNPSETMRKGIDPALGFPEFGELVDRYASTTGRSTAALPWYAAFGYFKLAVLRGQIHRRYLDGHTPREDFEQVGKLIGPLVDESLRTLETL